MPTGDIQISGNRETRENILMDSVQIKYILRTGDTITMINLHWIGRSGELAYYASNFLLITKLGATFLVGLFILAYDLCCRLRSQIKKKKVFIIIRLTNLITNITTPRLDCINMYILYFD